MTAAAPASRRVRPRAGSGAARATNDKTAAMADVSACRSCSLPGPCRLWPQVRPPLLLPLDDLHHAGVDIADAIQHVRPGKLLAAHRVFARDAPAAAGKRFADAIADDRIELQHADSRPVGDDLDLDVLRAQIR